MKRVPSIIAGLAAGLLIAVSFTLIAGPVSVPNSFSPGTPARAAEVNANFTAVADAVNDNAARVAALEANGQEPDVTPTGNLVLEPSIATAGNILKGTDSFIHNFGENNTFVGLDAGNFTMTGHSNTATGAFALSTSTSGSFNTASGRSALFANAAGTANTASGSFAMANNTTGDFNSAFGSDALLVNVDGSHNTGLGAFALARNTTGIGNVAVGSGALFFSTTGAGNTAVGVDALRNGITGSVNVAVGRFALSSNSAGDWNVAIGTAALRDNTQGSFNIAIGPGAGSNLTTGSESIHIGHPGFATEGKTIRVGSSQQRTFIAGIRGVTTQALDAVNVVIDSSGQLGTLSSSRRYKQHIADMGAASSLLMQLRPVTFHYKSGRNPRETTLQYGLIAEEVAEVAPGLVARSQSGDMETVYYRFLPPMLLNELQKQQRAIEAQGARLAELERERRAHVAKMQEQGALLASLEKRLDAFVARNRRAARIDEPSTIGDSGR